MEQLNHKKLKIIHCFRSPVGGIFRHVRDLLDAQHANGHEVGIICDSNSGGAFEENLFNDIKSKLALGLYRIPMERSISPRDAIALIKIASHLRTIKPDVVHSHSAKGGVYGRLGARLCSLGKIKANSFYCPHGGTMHYDKNTLKGKIYFTVERFMEHFTDCLIFVSDYERNAYHDKVGKPRCEEEVVYNGLNPDEFLPVNLTQNPADFLYIGMMRDLKGPDVFLNAIKHAEKNFGKKLTAYFVGDGPDKDRYIAQISKLGLENRVIVKNAMPVREALTMAKVVVVPSRAESMPYLVLETVAAQKPIVVTNVGGIPEIFDGSGKQLVTPDDASALCHEMLETLGNSTDQSIVLTASEKLKEKFSLQVASQHIEAIYKRDW